MRGRIRLILVSVAALAITFLAGCSLQAPKGVDPVAYQLRQAELNLDAVSDAVQVAGYTEDDLARINSVIDRVRTVINSAQQIQGAKSQLELVENALPLLDEAVANMPNERTRADAKRAVATLRVAVTLMRNQEKLREEFPPQPTETGAGVQPASAAPA